MADLSSPEAIAFRLRNLAQSMAAGSEAFARDHQAWTRVEELAEAVAALRAAPADLAERHAATERDACQLARIAEEHRDGRLTALERVAELEAKLRSATEWQPMETAPRDGAVVLVAIGGSDIPQPCRFRDRVGWVIAWDEWRIPAHDGPLGWMPLPAAARPQGVR